MVNPSILARRLADAPVANDLAEVGITSMTQVLDFFLLGDRAVSEFARTGELNTDDHPRLEFFAPRSLGRRQSWADNFAALRPAREPIDAYLADADSANAVASCALVRRNHLQAGRPIGRARGPRRRGPGGLHGGRSSEPGRRSCAESGSTGSVAHWPLNDESARQPEICSTRWQGAEMVPRTGPG